MDVTWDCSKHNLDNRQILEDLLPRDFKYQITSFNLLGKSNICSESQFSATMNVNCCDEESLKIFLVEYQKISQCSYNIQKGDKKNSKTLIISGSRKCHFNVRKRGKKSDSSELSNDKTAGKNTNCEASISFRILKTEAHSDEPHCQLFPLQLTINNIHNHCIESASALKYNAVSPETKSAFETLFNEGKDIHIGAQINKCFFL